MIRAKRKGAFGFVIHPVIHYACALVALLAFARGAVWTPFTQLLLIFYAALHITLDYLKLRYLTAGGKPDSTGPFVVDQLLHLLMVIALTLALLRIWPPSTLARRSLDRASQAHSSPVACYLRRGHFRGRILSSLLTRSLTESMVPPFGENREALRNAGLYIGWLERFLALTALLVQSPAMIGLILTGKSIARLSELKGPQFAEYFLIGTFLSVSLALSGGVFLQLMLYGTVFPK